MPRRFKKKVGKIRATRSCGRGNTKKGRGKGNRGGVGRSGMKKHKWTYMIKYEKHLMGSRGFNRPGNTAKKAYDTINVFMIDNMAKSGKLEKKGDLYVFEFMGKVLGTGEITVPVNVRSLRATEKAIQKIKSAGGNLEIISKQVKRQVEKGEAKKLSS